MFIWDETLVSLVLLYNVRTEQLRHLKASQFPAVPERKGQARSWGTRVSGEQGLGQGRYCGFRGSSL